MGRQVPLVASLALFNMQRQLVITYSGIPWIFEPAIPYTYEH